MNLTITTGRAEISTQSQAAVTDPDRRIRYCRAGLCSIRSLSVESMNPLVPAPGPHRCYSYTTTPRSAASDHVGPSIPPSPAHPGTWKRERAETSGWNLGTNTAAVRPLLPQARTEQPACRQRDRWTPPSRRDWRSLRPPHRRIMSECRGR